MASGRPDLYAVLGVPRTATTAELTAAYRRRARTTHPDAGGDALAFRAVSRAFDVLSDPGLRAGYDAELDDEPGAPRPSQPGQPEAGEGQRAGSSTAPPRASGPQRPAADTSAAAARPTAPPQFGPASRVDLGQIQWAEPFLGLEEAELRRRLRVVPGRSRLVVRGLLWAVTLAWCVAGVWIGRHRLPGDGDSPLWAGWALLWWLTAAVIGVQVRAGYRTAGLRPAGHTAARLLHQVAGAEHAVVLDRKVALIGTSAAPVLAGCQVRAWPLDIVDDPVRAVEEMGRWLLEGTDGWTVDRRALATVH